jgi:2-methylcitrate dehydratase PrpD
MAGQHESERETPLARALARAVLGLSPEALGPEVTEKARLCLRDLIACALESRALPWGRQALALAESSAGAATVIGGPAGTGLAEAAFANGVLGHGLVREDMHAGSVSHLGVAIWPALLALAQARRVAGADLAAGAVAGYEVGARLGRALIDPALARIHRPTGITGPIAAAAAGARALRLDEDAAVAALALAANTTAGLNEWAHTGGSEMYFHPGFAARNAVTAVLLAAEGAFASPSALDGPAGLFASLGRQSIAVHLFDGAPEILAVYHKPVPACNFAQTACQAALRLIADGVHSDDVARIVVRVPSAAARYPGCDFAGPFTQPLQGKMSIQYNVAAALRYGEVVERNYLQLGDVEVARLLAHTRIEVDDAMTRAFPARQGAEVEVSLREGATRRARLDDLVPATPEEVRARFRIAAEAALGPARARELAAAVDSLDRLKDAGRLAALCAPAEGAVVQPLRA